MAAITERLIGNQKNANSTNTEIILYLCQNGRLERSVLSNTGKDRGDGNSHVLLVGAETVHTLWKTIRPYLVKLNICVPPLLDYKLHKDKILFSVIHYFLFYT